MIRNEGQVRTGMVKGDPACKKFTINSLLMYLFCYQYENLSLYKNIDKFHSIYMHFVFNYINMETP